MAAALRNLGVALQQLAAALPARTGAPVEKGGALPGALFPAIPVPALPSTPLPSGALSSRAPSSSGTTTLLPLVPRSTGGRALPALAPSASGGPNALLATGSARLASSSTPNLNWPDVAVIAVVAGVILALLLPRRRTQIRHDNKG